MLMLGTVFAYFLMALPELTAKDEPELFKVEGNVSALPSSGFAGLWTIAGRRVNVTASTKVEQEAGPLVMGACAEAEGNLDAAGTLQAVKLESTISTECNTTGGGTGGACGTGRTGPLPKLRRGPARCRGAGRSPVGALSRSLPMECAA
jgi:hypothetical protein